MAKPRRLVLVATLLASSLALLTACVQAPPAPAPSVPATIAPQTGSTNVANPVLRPGESAAANQQYFDMVNASFFAANGFSDGRSIIDNLVAAGFQKQDMEVTPDRTSIDLAADSIIFSVRIQGECLIGQSSSTGYHSELTSLLATGGCLVGKTRPIDW